jgi:lambda repressor-like predicted transcriptional regulator
MHIEETQHKFMELRAQGWSLRHIATELHVSKTTLVEWNRAFASDIQSLRAAELELLKEKIIASREEELDRLARLRKDVNDELAHRTLRLIPIEKLCALSRPQFMAARPLGSPSAEAPEMNALRRDPHSGHQSLYRGRLQQHRTRQSSGNFDEI